MSSPSKLDAPERIATTEERKIERRKVTKKLRFEIFKRDSFTCQYCGESAPSVVLHADHIKPVSKGGKTDMVNMVTSCAGCNGGKGARELSDDSAVSLQQAQIAELQEKRLQLDMMLDWRGAVQDIQLDSIDAVAEVINQHLEGRHLNQAGLRDVGKLLKKHGLPVMFDAVDKAADAYLKYEADGDVCGESVSVFFKKLGGVCRNLGKDEYEQRKHYVKGIINNRHRQMHQDTVSWFFDEYENAKSAGVPLIHIENAAKQSTGIQDAIETIGELAEAYAKEGGNCE